MTSINQNFMPFLLFAQSKAFAQRIFTIGQRRTLFKPPANLPYYGLYRTNGEICRQDDILVCQRKMNYHPGANVRWQNYRGLQLLKANCDGTVMITREKCDLNTEMEVVQKYYAYRDYKDIYKLTFNVIPRRMSNTFLLVDEE